MRILSKVSIGGAVAFLISLALAGTLRNQSPELKRTQVEINGARIIAEVARTPQEQSRGLSGRLSIAPDAGMLFLFQRADRHAFWMRGMLIPIDIIWIQNGRVIWIEEGVDPQVGSPVGELRRYTPPEPADTVLELAAGRARLLGLQLGDAVTVDLR